MRFTLIAKGDSIPEVGINQAYLRVDNWNDFSYVTMFDVVLYDRNGIKYDLNSVKIGFFGQTTSQKTYSSLSTQFSELDDQYFSVGQDVSYYDKLVNELEEETRIEYLRGLKDIVYDDSRMSEIEKEDVFLTSLIRYVSISTINGQLKRVLSGDAVLSDFNFDFERAQGERVAGVKIPFSVKANSQPSTNIHALIGRNGVGKTTLLNEMISSITRSSTDAGFYIKGLMDTRASIPDNYFSCLISVSFSAFDPFVPPPENLDANLGTRYTYIGLKDDQDESGTRLKSLERLREECVASLKECFSDTWRKNRWLNAIVTLQSDENFERMGLCRLAKLSGEQLSETAKGLVELMSSGHAIVLLTISRLVARVEEKTLVLIDEPESHLHPPLLSAFTRALSQLLHNRNGVAIVATHSPVVLQEVPRSCVQVITRLRWSMHAEQPRLETFGENVGSLTREVFGLEVSRSGYHALLQSDVLKGGSYEEILHSYGGQLGLEARGILRAMVANRDEKSSDT